MARVRLLDRGVQATAIVTDVFQTETSVNRVILWQLRYRYRDPGGTEHEAASDLLMPDEAADWEAGATGPILYDLRCSATSVGRHAAPADPAAPRIGARMWSKAKTLMHWIINLALFFAALIVAAVILELVPELKELEAWMTDQRLPLVLATGGMALLGVFLLIGAMISMLMEGGEPMEHADIENQQRSMRDAAMGQHGWRASAYSLFGTGAGASGHDEFSMSQLKRAVASGAILSDSTWRRRVCAACGAALMFLGIFGLVIKVACRLRSSWSLPRSRSTLSCASRGHTRTLNHVRPLRSAGASRDRAGLALRLSQGRVPSATLPASFTTQLQRNGCRFSVFTLSGGPGGGADCDGG